MAELQLDFVHEGPAESIPSVAGNTKDETLVYLGERIGQIVSRVGSVGRVVKCDYSRGKASVVLFQYHAPSREVNSVVDKLGPDELRRSVVLAHTGGKFYLVEKACAHSLCGTLSCV